MKIPFLGGAYQSRSPILGSQTAINIYPELSEAGGDEVGAFYGTPGLSAVYTGTGEVRALHVAGGYLFAVIGSTVYRLDSSYSATSLGTLTTVSGPVSMAHNDTQFVVADIGGIYWVAFGGSAIASVTNGPSGGSILTASDSYILFTYPGTAQFGITAPADATSISALDVATAEGDTDNIVSMIANYRDIWLFGEQTTEIWTDTGNATFPWERGPSGFIEQGCCAARSPAKIDNSIFWLGRDKNGQGMVYRNNGYLPLRISTHAIEYAIASYSDISDAKGYTYQEEGHSFYVLTFPTGNATWVYDIATKLWHQRAYLSGPDLIRHRANCYANFNGSHLVGDYTNGKIYDMSMSYFDDAGDPIYRERAFELPTNDGKRRRIHRFELNVVQGDGQSGDIPLEPGDYGYLILEQGGYLLLESGGLTALDLGIQYPHANRNIVVLQISRDYGQTFGYERLVDLGRTGIRKSRCVWRNLGSVRYPVIKISTSMNKRVHWLSANMEASQFSK